MSGSNDHQVKAETVGEELYLIHLRRSAGISNEDDTELQPGRKRAHSVGEELYLVHLRRSAGLDMENDHYENEKNNKRMPVVVPTKPCRYNLRSRDSPASKN